MLHEQIGVLYFTSGIRVAHMAQSKRFLETVLHIRTTYLLKVSSQFHPANNQLER